MPQLFLKTKRSAFTYEPLGVIGVISPWNYPWSIPFGEVATGADGRQRRRAQAGLADPADRRADPPRVRARRRPRGAGPRRPRSRHRLGAGRVERGQGLLHRLGRDRARGRRGVRPAAEGLGARAGRQGSDDRARPTPTSSMRSPARCGAASPTPVRPARVSSACTCMREVSERFIAGVVRGARALRVGDPRRLGHRDRADDLPRAVRDRARAGRRCRRGRGEPALRRPGGSAAPGCTGDFYAPAVLTGVTHEMRIMREEIFGPVLPIVVVDSEDEAARAGQRQRVRPRRLGVDLGSRPGRADRPRAAGRHGLDQRPHVQPRRVPVLVGRGQGVGARPHSLQVRPVRVRQRQAAGVGALDDPQPVVASLRRDARPGAARRPRRSSTAGPRSAPRPLRDGAAPLLRLGRGWPEASALVRAPLRTGDERGRPRREITTGYA